MSRKSEAISQRLSLDACLMGCFQCLFPLPQVPGEKLLDWKDRTRAQTELGHGGGSSTPKGKAEGGKNLPPSFSSRGEVRPGPWPGWRAVRLLTQLREGYQLFCAAHSTRNLGRSNGMIPVLKLLSLPYTHAMYIYWLAGS